MKRLVAALTPTVALAVVLLNPSPVTAQDDVGIGTSGTTDTVLTIEATETSVVLGQNLDLSIDITNTASIDSAALVIHLDITDPAKSSSVDPEDWTSTLSKTVGVIGPGESMTVSWNIQPISGGTFAVYAVALAPDIETTSVSNVVHVEVADERSLNPSGILPVALATPTVVGALLLGQLRLARRTSKR